MSIMERIYQLADERNMSHSELAKRSGISKSTFSNLQERNGVPRMETIFRICEGCGISVSEFFAGVDAL